LISTGFESPEEARRETEKSLGGENNDSYGILPFPRNGFCR
jgi:hypothetical protein